MDEDMAKQQASAVAGSEVVALTSGEQLAGYPLRYVGDGEYVMGVPARDLTTAEAAQYADRITQTAQATGRALYVPSEA